MRGITQRLSKLILHWQIETSLCSKEMAKNLPCTAYPNRERPSHWGTVTPRELFWNEFIHLWNLVIWKGIFKINFHYRLPVKKKFRKRQESEGKESKWESLWDGEERWHVYLHVFVVLFWKQIAAAKYSIASFRNSNDFVKLEFNFTGTSHNIEFIMLLSQSRLGACYKL